MKTFVVGPCDAMLGDPEDVRIMRAVQAPTREEALDKYWAEYEPSDLDIEYCCSMSVNGSILAEFFHDEAGYMFDESTGEFREDILRSFKGDESGLRAYLRRNTEALVREFFEDRTDFADAFMAAYDQSLLSPKSEIRFTRDMLIYMLRKSNYPDVTAQQIKVMK